LEKRRQGYTVPKSGIHLSISFQYYNAFILGYSVPRLAREFIGGRCRKHRKEESPTSRRLPRHASSKSKELMFLEFTPLKTCYLQKAR
jgi:hypothetical protein